jgi:hypothetical protein
MPSNDEFGRKTGDRRVEESNGNLTKASLHLWASIALMGEQMFAIK